MSLIDEVRQKLKLQGSEDHVEPWTVPAQNGRRYLVTGANSGLGKETVKRLAAAGAHVILAVRSQEKGEATLAELREQQPDADLDLRILDLASLESIRSFVATLTAEQVGVDVLVNNAGVMAPPERRETADGFELQFGTNFLGPFALTNLLLPTLLKGDKPRVATVSSLAALFGRINMGDLQSRRHYIPFLAYSQSKLADLLLGQHLAQVAAQRDWPLISTMAHPGMTRTNLVVNGQLAGGREARDTKLPPAMMQQVEVGTDPQLRAAADPTAKNGEYYGPGHNLGLVGPAVPIKIPRVGAKPELATNLWTVAESLTGTRLPD